MNSFVMGFLESLLSANAHFTVTSAKRTPKQNEAAGGVPNSQRRKQLRQRNAGNLNDRVSNFYRDSIVEPLRLRPSL